MRRRPGWSLRGLVPLSALTLAACANQSIPADALRLPESTLDIRSIQTRTLEAPSENDILAASVAVLQDMEFNIDRVEKRLGVITASKSADADSTAEQAGLIFLDVLCGIGSKSVGCGAHATAADDQEITLTLVVLPSLARPNDFTARITLQRVVYDRANRIKELERIDDPLIYQTIFTNLQKSLFIEISEG